MTFGKHYQALTRVECHRHSELALYTLAMDVPAAPHFMKSLAARDSSVDGIMLATLAAYYTGMVSSLEKCSLISVSFHAPFLQLALHELRYNTLRIQ